MLLDYRPGESHGQAVVRSQNSPRVCSQRRDTRLGSQVSLLSGPARKRNCLEGAIPVLGELTIFEAQHIEPGGGVLPAFIDRIVVLAYKRKRHIITFGLYRDQIGKSVGNRQRPSERFEE